MKGRGRAVRVGELIRRDIASMLTKGLKDPRLGFVSVMAVEMSSDLHYANVYVSLLGSEAERKSSLIGLRHSSGWIRRSIGKNLRLRVTPEIRFFEDDSLDRVYHLEEILRGIRTESAPSDSAGEALSSPAAADEADVDSEGEDGSH